MTVCIAAACRWYYPAKEEGQPPVPGFAILTLSDRMVTAGDIEYEPPQKKCSFLFPKAIVLIGGDYSIHSQALARTHAQLKNSLFTRPYDIACVYGQAIQAIQRKVAEDKILAPLGLNTDSLLGQSKELSEPLVASLTSQLQDFEGADVEALIVGNTPEEGHIYTVNRHGTIQCFDDIGFAAIGIGAWHAQSRLMQIGYTNTWLFAPALAATYAAKKAAELAPGVGKVTDIHLALRDSIEPLLPEVYKSVETLYAKYLQESLALSGRFVTELNDAMGKGPVTEVSNEAAKEDPKKLEARFDAGANRETPR